MPYSTLKKVNPAIRGIKPAVSLEQANLIASWADKMKDVKSPWAVAISQFKKSHTVRSGKWVKRMVDKTKTKPAEEMNMGMMSLAQVLTHIRVSFEKWFRSQQTSEYVYCYCEDVMPAHPTLGAVVIFRAFGGNWALTYTMDEQGNITFDPLDNKEPVMQTWIPIEDEELPAGDNNADDSMSEEATAERNTDEAIIVAELHESGAELLEEADKAYLDIVLCEPGIGNQRDRNYYTKEMWQQNAHKFEGVKMFEVEHDDAKRDNRTWVATIVEAGKRFDDKTGAPIVKTFIHDPVFADKAKNLKEAGLLSKLQNSIVALAKTVATTVNGQAVNLVQEIIRPKYVDFVNAAGAGGRAIALYENIADLDFVTFEALETQRPDLIKVIQERTEQPMNEEEIKQLQESLAQTQTALATLTETTAKQVQEGRRDVFTAMVASAKLPDAAKDRVRARFTEPLADNFKTQVETAIAEEAEYLSKFSVGSVTGLGETEQTPPQQNYQVLSTQEFDAQVAQLNQRYGGY